MPGIDIDTGKRGKDAQRAVSLFEDRREKELVELGSKSRP
jgi:hypothetical protein